MFWAAEGSANAEKPAINEAQRLEIPLGTYHYTKADGSPGMRSPSKRAKHKIIARSLAGAAIEAGDKLALLDEVQGGGTVIQLVRGSLRYARDHGLALPIHLIATEDQYAVNREKTSRYRSLASNYVEGVATTVVKLPLIACDRDALLDRVVVEGPYNLDDESANVFTVHRNTMAESLLRNLGSMARHEELVHDDDYLRAVFDPMFTDNVQLANRFEDWLGQVFIPPHSPGGS